jgi:hypothetical protein
VAHLLSFLFSSSSLFIHTVLFFTTFCALDVLLSRQFWQRISSLSLLFVDEISGRETDISSRFYLSFLTVFISLQVIGIRRGFRFDVGEVYFFPVPVCAITASGVPGGTLVSVNRFSTLCG